MSVGDARFASLYMNAFTNDHDGDALPANTVKGSLSRDLDSHGDAWTESPTSCTGPEDDAACSPGYDSDSELMLALGVDPLVDYSSDSDSTVDIVDRLMSGSGQQLSVYVEPLRWARMRKRLAAFGMFVAILEHVRTKRALNMLRVSGLVQDDTAWQVMQFVQSPGLNAEEKYKLLQKTGPGWRRARVESLRSTWADVRPAARYMEAGHAPSRAVAWP